jgi:hypothetical protein
VMPVGTPSPGIAFSAGSCLRTSSQAPERAWPDHLPALAAAELAVLSAVPPGPVAAETALSETIAGKVGTFPMFLADLISVWF